MAVDCDRGSYHISPLRWAGIMATRDYTTYALKCAKCGNHGEMRASEDDYAFMRDPDFRVESLPEGFEVTVAAPRQEDTRISCIHCRVRVW